MYVESEDMIQALIRYGVSELGIQSFWSILALEDGKQWHTDAFHIKERK